MTPVSGRIETRNAEQHFRPATDGLDPKAELVLAEGCWRRRIGSGRQTPCLRAAEPVVALVLPVAAGVVVRDEDRAHELRALECRASSARAPSWEIRTLSEAASRRIHCQYGLRMQGRRHVQARLVAVRALEADILRLWCPRRPAQGSRNGTPLQEPIALQPSMQMWRVIWPSWGSCRSRSRVQGVRSSTVPDDLQLPVRLLISGACPRDRRRCRGTAA